MKDLETKKTRSYKEAIVNISVINEFRVFYNRQVSNYNYVHRLFDGDDGYMYYLTNDDIETMLSKATPEDINRVKDAIKPIYNDYLDRLFKEVFPLMEVVSGLNNLDED